jgi:hypothetical protein
MNRQIYELLTADGAWRGGEGARDGRQGGARTTSAGLQQQLGAVAGRRVCARRLVWSGRGAVSIDTLQLAYTSPHHPCARQDRGSHGGEGGGEQGHGEEGARRWAAG